MATGDGSPVKTQKSKVLDILEKSISSSLDAIPPCTAFIIDAMALLQTLVHPASTFGGIAEQLFSMMKTYLTAPGARLDFVVDQYRSPSIKAGERHARAKTRGSVRLRILSSAQKTPIQWKKFVANSENKTDLLHFLAVE